MADSMSDPVSISLPDLKPSWHGPTAKQFWCSLAAVIVLSGVLAGWSFKANPMPWPAPVILPLPSPVVPPAPGPAPESIGIARQKAKLQLSDGRTATFTFAESGKALSCTAAVGLDQVLSYDLVPASDAWPPEPIPPEPKPPQPPTPTPAPTSNLRVLFLYDPLTLIDMPPGQQAILAAPEVRSYLDQHCPLESGCVSGKCPRNATTRTPSYRFLPSQADPSHLTPVWQQTLQAAAGKPLPRMIAVNEAGQTVIDQAWPNTVEETLALLKKCGGP